MPFYPTVEETRASQQVTDTFMGYNHNLKIMEGEFYDMKNMTSDYCPMLANRGKRGVVKRLENPGGILAKEKLACVDNGKLYYDGVEVPGIELTLGEKQLVSMGAYLVIWPDKVFVNTSDLTDHGSIDANVHITSNLKFELCEADGKVIENYATSKPASPKNGDYWLDTSTTPHSLKKYYSYSNSWSTVASSYLKLSATGIGSQFKKYDGVKISGIAYPATEDTDQTLIEEYDSLNSTKVIYILDENYIVILGLVSELLTLETCDVTIERKSPDLDYVTEASNRIWGCKYGVVDDKPVNEIYCCSLGDFRNWNEFQGISTDSYVASVGTDGKWTGAITHLGYPIFFKENVMHKVYISPIGAHQIQDTACRGVQEGCNKSLAIVGERLYYKSRSGIMMYDGSLPVSISDVLGQDKFFDAVAGAVDNKYYVSMRDENHEFSLYVYDTSKELWHKEDNTNALCFTKSGSELFYVDVDSKLLMSVNGTVGEEEGTVEWSATTGVIGYNTVEQKYVSRFNIRMKLPKGSSADMFIEYDSDGVWNHCGHMNGVGTNTFMLPVRPKRCDHFRFRIEGTGDVRVYSISKIFEAGSDTL